MTQPSNNSQSLFKAIAAMQWLALPVIALMYAAVWQQLPSRLATHFDLANQPNGWMSREETLVIFLALATVFAITSTWICSRVTEPDPTAWGMVGLFYVVLATLIWAEHSVIAYNISGQPVDVAPVLMVGMISAILLVVLALGTRRGSQLPVGRIFAKESHSSALWAIVTGLPAILLLGAAAKARIPGLRFALGVAVAMMVAAAAMAASGFHYIFTPAGVEIRTLGFRLRSISAAEIRSYAVDRWNWLGGYGIRGVGNIRAYVWSNSGVRIHTAAGEVFLGHSDPKKIVRDLDLVMRNQKGLEATRT
jgi:uncharacterized membrane protein